MTTDQDIERVLDSWLSEGPTRMPSRFFDETFGRIDRLPAERSAGLRATVRAARLEPRLLAAAAVIVLVATIGSIVVLGGAGVGAGPSPTPSIVPSPSSSAQAKVDASLLQAKWTSVGHPPETGSVPTELTIDGAMMSIFTHMRTVDSSWTLDATDGHLAVDMVSTQPSLTDILWDCRPGQTGAYAIGLSTDGSTMTLAPIADECARREAILAGDWTRWPCPNPDSTCQPELTPGRHVSTFDPSTTEGGAHGFSYVVPAGWSLPSSNVLARPNDPATMAIIITPEVAAYSRDADCPDAVDLGIGMGAEALAHWLTGLPGLVTTTPKRIGIGPGDGWMLDVAVAQSWTVACPSQFIEKPTRVVFTFADPVTRSDPGAGITVRDSLEGDARARYVLLDVAVGYHNVLVEITAPDKASWDDFVQVAMPIVESIEVIR